MSVFDGTPVKVGDKFRIPPTGQEVWVDGFVAGPDGTGIVVRTLDGRRMAVTAGELTYRERDFAPDADGILDAMRTDSSEDLAQMVRQSYALDLDGLTMLGRHYDRPEDVDHIIRLGEAMRVRAQAYALAIEKLLEYHREAAATGRGGDKR